MPLNINNFRQYFIGVITFFILIFLICPAAQSVLPPKYYEEVSSSSSIQAIAVVKKVESLSETDQATTKKEPLYDQN
jgi:uncharacterized membrane protein